MIIRRGAGTQFIAGSLMEIDSLESSRTLPLNAAIGGG
jgi:hypothetical protein